jgi:hypothetical protein
MCVKDDYGEMKRMVEGAVVAYFNIILIFTWKDESKKLKIVLDRHISMGLTSSVQWNCRTTHVK